MKALSSALVFYWLPMIEARKIICPFALFFNELRCLYVICLSFDSGRARHRDEEGMGKNLPAYSFFP